MAARTQRYMSNAESAEAAGAAARAQEQRQAAEIELGMMEQYLGSEEQLSGSGVDPGLLPYTQRYQFDTETIAGLGGGGWGHDNIMANRLNEQGWGEYGQGIGSGKYANSVSGYAGYVQEQANSLLDQAQAAYEAGDVEAAERLKGEADALITNASPTKNAPLSSNFTGAFYLQGDAAYNAKAKLGGVADKLVGTQLREAYDLQDRDSQAYKDLKEAYTGDALRAIGAGKDEANLRLAQQQRASRRQMRDIGLSRGAGYSATAQMALSARSAERFGTESAAIEMQAARAQSEVLSQASQIIEQHRAQFGQNMALFSQNWLQSKSGIREEYQGAMDNLLALSAQMADSAAARNVQFAQLSQQAELASKQRTFDFIKMGVDSLVSITNTAMGAAGGAGGFGSLF